MIRALLFVCFLIFTTIAANAQVRPISPPRDTLTLNDTTRRLGPDPSLAPKRLDTLKAKYINPGKIAGRKAMIRSAILPGMGQIGNGVTVYRLAKVAGIYVGATMLTLSYIENNRQFHMFSNEIAGREKGKVEFVDEDLKPYPTPQLITGKGTYQRNREVVVFSFIGLYLLNIADAYIDSRLKYWEVGDVGALKISPAMINSGPIYGFNSISPGLRITLTL